MNFEIEKKYVVLDFEYVREYLKKKYGKPIKENKAGFWFTESKNTNIDILDFNDRIITKKTIESINKLIQIKIPEDDYLFLRLRIKNKDQFILTVKNKSLINNIENNVEYEYELDIERFDEVVHYLYHSCPIFFYNIKKTWAFKDNDLNIELSRFEDLKNAYIEFELSGDDKDILNEKLEKHLINFKDLPINEDPTSYHRLSLSENSNSLKNKKVREYSNIAYNKLFNYIKNNFQD